MGMGPQLHFPCLEVGAAFSTGPACGQSDCFCRGGPTSRADAAATLTTGAQRDLLSPLLPTCPPLRFPSAPIQLMLRTVYSEIPSWAL